MRSGNSRTKSHKIAKVLEILKGLYPQTHSELIYETPFQLLVSTILSAQASDRKVNEVTKGLYEKYKTPCDFAALDEDTLSQEITQIHLYPAKARYIIAASRTLVEKYGGQVPADRNKLMELKGVGRKTANCILSYAFGIPAIAVDTHVFRVANRIGIVKASTPEKTELEMERTIPEVEWSIAHSSLVLHGRRICDARKPKCDICELKEYCMFYIKKEQL